VVAAQGFDPSCSWSTRKGSLLCPRARGGEAALFAVLVEQARRAASATLELGPVLAALPLRFGRPCFVCCRRPGPAEERKENSASSRGFPGLKKGKLMGMDLEMKKAAAAHAGASPHGLALGEKQSSFRWQGTSNTKRKKQAETLMSG